MSGSVAAQTSTRRAALDSVVAAERAFSKMSVERGMREAFLSNLAPDAIVFRPGPRNGREVYGSLQPSPTQLSWEPVFADVSNAGDLGYTTGPYELRPGGATDTTARHGHYVTLWRRSSGGGYVVALDIGTPHTTPPTAVFSTRVNGGRSWGDPIAARRAMLLADSLLGVGDRTEVAALGPLLAADSRLHRSGVLPVVGATAIKRTLAGNSALYDAVPIGGEVASSGDLGYTYGRYMLIAGDAPSAREDEGYYVRIWRRNAAGAWYVVLDLATSREE